MCCNGHFFPHFHKLCEKRKSDLIYRIILYPIHCNSEARTSENRLIFIFIKEYDGKELGECCFVAKQPPQGEREGWGWRSCRDHKVYRRFDHGKGGDNDLLVENHEHKGGISVRQDQNGMRKMAQDKDSQFKSGNNYYEAKTTEFHITLVSVCKGSWRRYLGWVYFLELSNINLLSLIY
jgi:hypothetical protein